MKKPSYSKVVRDTQAQRGTNTASPAVATAAATSATTSRLQKKGLTDYTKINKRTVSLNTGRSKAEKADFAVVKQKLQGRLNKTKVIEGLKIQFPHPSPRDKIDTVFQDKA